MSADLTIITATIPGREKLLERALVSVRQQTLKPVVHAYKLDEKREGGAATKNRLMDFVKTEWVIILDDDDMLLPDHIATVYEQRDKADIIYTYAKGNGRYNRPFDFDALMADSVVAHTAMFRTKMFHQLGKFKVELGYDWKLWRDAANHGFSFLSLPVETWYYDLDESRPHESLGGLRWDGC